MMFVSPSPRSAFKSAAQLVPLSVILPTPTVMPSAIALKFGAAPLAAPARPRTPPPAFVKFVRPSTSSSLSPADSHVTPSCALFSSLSSTMIAST